VNRATTRFCVSRSERAGQAWRASGVLVEFCRLAALHHRLLQVAVLVRRCSKASISASMLDNILAMAICSGRGGSLISIFPSCPAQSSFVWCHHIAR